MSMNIKRKINKNMYDKMDIYVVSKCVEIKIITAYKRKQIATSH